MRDEAIAVMHEAGIDISAQRPKSIAAVMGPDVRLVVGLCAEEACPVLPGVPSLHWPLANPPAGSMPAFRDVRDELSRRIRLLIPDLD